MEALIAASREIQQQVTKINQRVGDEYMPQVYDGRVTFFRAQRLGMRHAYFGQIDPQRGWRSLAMGGVLVRPVGGTHVGVLTNPHVSGLAEQLNVTLRTAMAANQ